MVAPSRGEKHFSNRTSVQSGESNGVGGLRISGERTKHRQMRLREPGRQAGGHQVKAVVGVWKEVEPVA